MAKSIVVRILHNQDERNSFAVGYRHGDPLIQVYEGEHRLLYREEIEMSLELIFEQNHQWGGSNHQPWYKSARSLSVGDVIVIHNRAFACEEIGFREINPVDAGIEELVGG